jgi:hypothetical protein
VVQRAIWANTWFAKEQDMTKDGWPVAQLVIHYRLITN